MKKYKDRVEFGAERRIVQAGADTCAECGCMLESDHIPGCSWEECPTCGKAVIGCCCESLSPLDGERIIQAIYSQFSDLEAALQSAGEEEGCRGSGRSSYLQHAVMRYIFNNVPDTAKHEITRAFHIRFPGLIPRLQDEEGRGYFTAEQLSEALDIPVSEVNERIEAMVSASNSLPLGMGKKLRKVH